jgi:hypothetical protein
MNGCGEHICVLLSFALRRLAFLRYSIYCGGFFLIAFWFGAGHAQSNEENVVFGLVIIWTIYCGSHYYNLTELLLIVFHDGMAEFYSLTFHSLGKVDCDRIRVFNAKPTKDHPTAVLLQLPDGSIYHVPVTELEFGHLRHHVRTEEPAEETAGLQKRSYYAFVHAFVIFIFLSPLITCLFIYSLISRSWMILSALAFICTWSLGALSYVLGKKCGISTRSTLWKFVQD